MLNLLSYDFMQRALLAMVAMSLFFSYLRCYFLILRRQSLMSDTLSHVSLSGVAFWSLPWFLSDYLYSPCGDHGGCISRVLTHSL